MYYLLQIIKNNKKYYGDLNHFRSICNVADEFYETSKSGTLKLECYDHKSINTYVSLIFAGYCDIELVSFNLLFLLKTYPLKTIDNNIIERMIAERMECYSYIRLLNGIEHLHERCDTHHLKYIIMKVFQKIRA